MPVIEAICASERKGTPKTPRPHARLLADHGLEGDAHAGPGLRQVSILPLVHIEEFRRRGAAVAFGDFGENLVLSGPGAETLRVGDTLNCGEVALEVSQLGKDCHAHCQIRDMVGDCIMPRHGVFAIVRRGGELRVGDVMESSRRMEEPS